MDGRDKYSIALLLEAAESTAHRHDDFQKVRMIGFAVRVVAKWVESFFMVFHKLRIPRGIVRHDPCKRSLPDVVLLDRQ
jgi:hypothetical protein